MPKKSDYEEVYRQIITLLANVLAGPQPANDKVIRLSSMNRKHPSKRINIQSNNKATSRDEKYYEDLSKKVPTNEVIDWVRQQPLPSHGVTTLALDPGIIKEIYVKKID